MPPIIEHLPCVLWTYYHFYLAHFPCLNKINNLFYHYITARFQCGILHSIIMYHMFTAQSRASSQSRGRIRTQSRCSSPWAAPAPPSCSRGHPARSCTPATQKRAMAGYQQLWYERFQMKVQEGYATFYNHREGPSLQGPSPS